MSLAQFFLRGAFFFSARVFWFMAAQEAGDRQSLPGGSLGLGRRTNWQQMRRFQQEKLAAIGFFGHVSLTRCTNLESCKLLYWYKEALLLGKFGIGIASGKPSPASAKTLASATPRIRAPKCKRRGAPPQ